MFCDWFSLLGLVVWCFRRGLVVAVFRLVVYVFDGLLVWVVAGCCYLWWTLLIVLDMLYS